MMEYLDFIKSKTIVDQDTGFKPNIRDTILFGFQKDITSWACRRGRAAIFSDCGTGKTPIQLTWADQVNRQTNKPVFILAPLAVSRQTKREGEKFGVDVNICESDADVKNGVNITNYEKLHRFDPALFSGVVLDESSILKSFTGKTRNQIIRAFSALPYKLACTATPAPNDFMELGNHSEFVGSLTRAEMLSMFFINDTSSVATWRLKRHAQDEFWKWVCSWAVMIRKPSDLGYDNDGFALPELNIISNVVNMDFDPGQFGELFLQEASTLSERREARKLSLEKRVEVAADLANKSSEQWLIWCDMNAESSLLSKSISDAVEVTGSDRPGVKEDRMLAFQSGEIRVLVTKPSIAGWGMNWQNCRNMAFVGLSDSYEQFYQAVRRCWRFGQNRTVNAHVIYSAREGSVVKNIKRKEDDAAIMADNMIKHMSGFTKSVINGATNDQTPYEAEKTITIPSWIREAS